MHRRSKIWVLAATLLLVSCSSAMEKQNIAVPLAVSDVPAILPVPKVALVLGSGGPRGYAHIGILKVLEQHNIQVDLIVGSSVGALIGSFWAAGYSAPEISALSAQGGPLTLFDFSLFLKQGWIKGQRLQDYVNSQLDNANIENLPKRLIVVATRKLDGAPVFFLEGNVGIAVRASSSVHNIFMPAEINNMEYIDADESLPVAVAAAKQAGARFVIAVDVAAKVNAAPAGTSAKQRAKDALRRSRIDPQVAQADFLLHPDLDYKAGPWRSYFVAAEREGERYANTQIEQLLAALHRTQASSAKQHSASHPPSDAAE